MVDMIKYFVLANGANDTNLEPCQNTLGPVIPALVLRDYGTRPVNHLLSDKVVNWPQPSSRATDDCDRQHIYTYNKEIRHIGCVATTSAAGSRTGYTQDLERFPRENEKGFCLGAGKR